MLSTPAAGRSGVAGAVFAPTRFAAAGRFGALGPFDAAARGGAEGRAGATLGFAAADFFDAGGFGLALGSDIGFAGAARPGARFDALA
jgi:hypothetical protein